MERFSILRFMEIVIDIQHTPIEFSMFCDDSPC